VADTTTASLQVTAMVQSRCIVKNGSLNFGVYDPIVNNSEQPLQGVGQLDVQCVKQTSTTLQLSSGNNAGHAVGTTRAMVSADGSSYLSYDIYTNPSSNAVWNTANTVNYTASNASPAAINVYGKIPANQQVENGTYFDSVLITANF
jgi:spore coat protein U-like protein